MNLEKESALISSVHFIIGKVFYPFNHGTKALLHNEKAYSKNSNTKHVPTNVPAPRVPTTRQQTLLLLVPTVCRFKVAVSVICCLSHAVGEGIIL